MEDNSTEVKVMKIISTIFLILFSLAMFFKFLLD